MVCKNYNISILYSGASGEYEIPGKSSETYSDLISTDVGSLSNSKYVCFAIAQSDLGESSGSTTIVTHGTTAFVEAESTVGGVASQPTTSTSTYLEEKVGIKDFLSKPQIITSGAWTTAQPVDTNLYTVSIASLLSSTTIWSEKIKGFGMIKGDFIVTVQINASPFQQGKLLLHYMPCVENFKTNQSRFEKRYNSLTIQKVQHPHVEIDCRNTSVKFRIPYVAPSHFYSLKDAKYDWGTVYLDVFSPLLTGPSAVSTYVDYTVYGHWENVELIAPTYPQSSGKYKRVNKNIVNETGENLGPVADGLKRIGKAANILGGVPILTPFTGPVEWAANLASNVASALGWSKPRELNGVSVMGQNLLRYAGTAEGPDTSLPGGIMMNNRLQTIDYGSYTNEDEMSLGYLLSIPTYLSAFTWSATAGPDTSLYSLELKPSNMYAQSSNTIGAHTMTYQCGAPLWYLQRLFKMWRGSIHLTLKFIKTQMHSGRLSITFTPGPSTPTIPNLAQSTYALRTIVDIRDDNEVTIELPYLVFSDYLHSDEQSGKLDIRVLNDLRGPESVSQTINVQVFFTAGKDFEYAVPVAQNTPALVYTPQSDSTVKIMHGGIGSEELMSGSIGAVSVDNDTMFHSTRCVGEKVTSIKQLLLRNSVLQGFSGFSFTALTSFAMDPGFIAGITMVGGTGVYNTPRIGGDIYNYLVPMYAFRRGGIRITTMCNKASQEYQIRSGVFPCAFTDSSNAEPIYTNAGAAWVENLSYNSSVAGTTAPTKSWLLEPANMYDVSNLNQQHIPYYNKFPFSLNLVQDGIDLIYTETSQPKGIYVATTANTFTDCLLQRSVCDDFQAMFFIACPPVVSAYV